MVAVYTLHFSKTFKKKLNKYKRAGQPNLKRLPVAFECLIEDKEMPEELFNHKLEKSRRFPNDFECHICPDLLLVYEYINDNSILIKDLDTHSNLYDK